MLRSLIAAGLALGASVVAMPDAAAQNLVPCAQEYGFCRVPYPTRVVYGIPGRNTAMDVRGQGIPCSNNVFGDPAPGIPKRCAYVARAYDRKFGRPLDGFDRPRGGYDGPQGGFERPMRGPHGPRREAVMGAWRPCAGENEFCNFRGPKRVRYGARGRFTEAVHRNGVACSNSTFGDPAPGIRKTCHILD